MAKRADPLVWKQEDDGARGRGDATTEPSRKLTRQAIIQAAVQVADTEGLDGVTIRHLATELGVKPMSLYVHIAKKDDLLALMANQLVGLTLADKPLPLDWREALNELSRRMRAVFLQHPWGLEVLARRPPVGPNGLRRAKQLARAVSGLGLEPAEVWTLLATVDDYVIGNVLRMTAGANHEGFDEAVGPGDLVEFPELAALSGAERPQAHAERFEAGLQAVLDGVEHRFLGQQPKS